MENDQSLIQSEQESFEGVFDSPPYCPEQPMIVRESTPTSDCSMCMCISDPFPSSPLIPQSPTSPDFSFLSCTHASSPDLSIELNASYLRSSTPDQVSQSQEKSTSLEDISTPPAPEQPLTPQLHHLCHYFATN